MKTLVTGGAGFIGSHLVDRLIRDDHMVQVIDNLSGGQNDFSAHHRGNPHFTLTELDLREHERLVKAIRPGTEMVFHLAANSDISKGIEDPTLDFENTTKATFSLLRAMKKLSIKKIFYTSGSGVYGDLGSRYITEAYGPLAPVSMYGATKLSAEGLICAFCNFYDMQAWIVRPANITGPRTTHGVTYDFVKRLTADPTELRILGDGNQSKAYLHVDDVVHAFLLIMKEAKEKISFFNLSSNTFVTVNEIAQIVCREMGLKHVNIQHTGGRVGWKGDVAVVRLRNTRLNKLGWKPKYSSQKTIIATVKSLLDDPRIIPSK